MKIRSGDGNGKAPYLRDMEATPLNGERLSIVRTEDGSYTLYDRELDETYHSGKGAIGESLHVFIERGFYAPALQKEREKGSMRILEVGFGTGLNAWLTQKEADKEGISVHYESLEPYPIPRETWEKFAEQLDEGAFRSIHEMDWEEAEALSPHFQLLKRRITLEELEEGEAFDLILYDAFGAKVRSGLWELPLLDHALKRGMEGSVFVTYAAKGSLKRGLKAKGWDVELLEGALGKREMVRAVKKGGA